HVFNEGDRNLSADEVLANWNSIKSEEKKNEKKYSMEKRLLNAPALDAAYNIGKKSTALNFDWPDYLQVMNKVEEEWLEVKEELPSNGIYSQDRVEEEIGDLLFSVAQLARHLNINPEKCLRKANQKF